MPFVEIHYIEGRMEEQREKLAKAITDSVAEIFNVPKESICIEFDEMRKTHFAISGVLRSKK
jgi:4-oxalocrotonate tautomerase family enzyme